VKDFNNQKATFFARLNTVNTRVKKPLKYQPFVNFYAVTLLSLYQISGKKLLALLLPVKRTLN